MEFLSGAIVHLKPLPCLIPLILCWLVRTVDAQGIIINEIDYNPANGSSLEFVELQNASNAAIDVSGWEFTNGIHYTIPPGNSVPAHGFLVVAKSPVDLAAAYSVAGIVVGGFESALDNGGDRVEISSAAGVVIDSIRYDNRFPWPVSADGFGGSLERICASAASQSARNWASDLVKGPTPGRANTSMSCPLPAYASPPVVINEIYYHPESDRDAQEELIELKNTTGSPINMSDWAISDGVDFTFPPGTSIAASGTLVVAADKAWVASTFGIANVVGDWTGSLSNDGERIALSDNLGKDIDALVYLDKGEWPVAADGTGRSLEKIVAAADGADPASWAAAACSGFQSVDVVGDATSSRIYIYFEGIAEGLIDDLSITPEAGGAEHLPGGDLNSDPGVTWTYSGNHVDSRWQSSGGVNDTGCLRVISNGTGGSSTNSASRFTSPDLVNGSSYRLRFKWKLLSGASALVVRLSGAPEQTGVFVRPSCKGLSPGVENSSAQATLPPFVAQASHTPGEPKSTQQVQVTAHVRGSGITQVKLGYNAGATANEVSMTDTGANGDGVAGDGIYGVTLPAFAHNTIVRYRIIASTAVSETRFPPGGDPSVDLAYYVNNDQPASPLPVYHILINNLNSLGCTTFQPATFVHGGEVYLNVGARNRGQTACGQTKNNLKLRFNKGRYFHGKKKINLNGLWSDKSEIREKLQWDLWRDQNQPHCESYHVRVHNNGAYFGLYIYVEHPDELYLDRNGLDKTGNLYKAVASTEQKQSSITGYMSAYEKKTNEDGDYSDLKTFVDQLNDTPEANILTWLHQNMELDATLDYEAVAVTSANVDHPHKNHYLYHDPGTNKWRSLIWDLDLSWGRTYVQENFGVYNDEIRTWNLTELYAVGGNSFVTRFFNARAPSTPAGKGYFHRAYLARLWAMLREKMNNTLTRDQAEALRDLLQDEQAEDFAKWGRFPSRPAPGSPAHPADFNYNVDELLDIGAAAGKGYLARRMTYLNSRLSQLGFTGYKWVRITEIMYNPFGPSEDLEFIELHNTETTAANIAGWYLPTVDYTFPGGTSLTAGETIVVAKNPTAFALAYPGVSARVFGPYTGNLGNDGAEIRLMDAKPSAGPTFPTYYPITVDFVRYGDSQPWPQLADGEGHSLETVDVALDNDYPENWRASVQPGGSPGALTPFAFTFRRGDTNTSATIEIADALRILNFLFKSGPAPDCLDAADVNDSGEVDIADAVRLVLYLFAGAPPPPAPGPVDCGSDPTSDALPACSLGC